MTLAIALVCGVGAAPAGELFDDRTARSPALGRALSYSIYLPEAANDDARLPVLYLLHGFGANQHEWRDLGGIAETLDDLIERGEIAPLIVVMPDGAKSWYVDSAAFGGPGDYATAIAHDLVAAIDGTYPTLASAAHRGIGGLSMGGHGALRLAFANPNVFGAVAALSPAIWKPDGVSWQTSPLEGLAAYRDDWFERTTGEAFDVEVFNAQSPFALVADLEALEAPPTVFLATGDDDGFWMHDGTVDLYLDLRAMGLAPELRVLDGGHDWTLWLAVTGDMLRFFDEELRSER
ncbi:MAG: alpha/beta hydrolase family protein [Pseudomonadota bacterium]